MKDNTVYLLYNTNATGIKLHHGPSLKLREDKSRLSWEYVDKDEFTIMYSPDDDRQSTDIKILSKTKLKDRPKSAEVLMKQPKGSIEGVLIRRSSSFSTIEDLFLVRRSPLIKPLLSELEIRRLQRLQQECRNKRFQDAERRKLTESIRAKDALIKQFSADQHLEPGEEVTKLSSLESPKEKLRGITHSPELDKRKVHTAPSESEKGLKGKIATKQIDFGSKVEGKAIGKIKSVPTAKKAAKEEAKLKKDNKARGTEKENKNVERKTKPAAKSAERKSSMKKEKAFTEKDKKTKKKQRTFESNEESIKSSKGKSKATRSKQLDNSDSVAKSKTTESRRKSSKQTKKGIVNVELDDSSDSVAKSKTTESRQKASKHKKGKNANGEQRTSKLEQPRETKSSIARKSSKSGKSTKYGDGKSNKLEKSDELGVDKSDKPQKKASEKTKNKKSLKSDDLSSLPDGKTLKETSIKEKKNKGKHEDEKKKVSIVDKAKSPLEKLQMNGWGSEKASDKTGEGKIKPGLPSEHPPSTPTMKRKSRVSSSVLLSVPHLKGNIKDEQRKRSKRLSNGFHNMLQYVLSNPVFINLGWTLRPSDRAMSRVVTFKTVPANPQGYCFRNREEVETKYYPSGSLAVKIEEDGTGRVNYASGEPAMIITKNNSGMRLTLYYDKTKDSFEKKALHSRVSGMFDSCGNGVVYDFQGKKILYFNQLAGIFNNPSTKFLYKWKWKDYKILEKQRVKELLNSMVTQSKQPKAIEEKKAVSFSASAGGKTLEKKSEVDIAYEGVLAELPYPVARKPEVQSESHSPGFKAIILKINEEMTLRINGQDNVTVNFSTNKIFYRVDLGVKVDPETVDRIEDLIADRVSDVPCVFDSLLHLSPSLKEINQQLDLTRDPNNKNVPRKKFN